MKMKARRQVWFLELGNFCESTCKRIREKMEGKTFHNFHVIYSNVHGNCQIGVEIDETPDTDEEVKQMFLNCALGMIA